MVHASSIAPVAGMKSRLWLLVWLAMLPRINVNAQNITIFCNSTVPSNSSSTDIFIFSQRENTVSSESFSLPADCDYLQSPIESIPCVNASPNLTRFSFVINLTASTMTSHPVFVLLYLTGGDRPIINGTCTGKLIHTATGKEITEMSTSGNAKSASPRSTTSSGTVYSHFHDVQTTMVVVLIAVVAISVILSNICFTVAMCRGNTLLPVKARSAAHGSCPDLVEKPKALKEDLTKGSDESSSTAAASTSVQPQQKPPHDQINQAPKGVPETEFASPSNASPKPMAEISRQTPSSMKKYVREPQEPPPQEKSTQASENSSSKPLTACPGHPAHVKQVGDRSSASPDNPYCVPLSPAPGKHLEGQADIAVASSTQDGTQDACHASNDAAFHLYNTLDQPSSVHGNSQLGPIEVHYIVTNVKRDCTFLDSDESRAQTPAGEPKTEQRPPMPKPTDQHPTSSSTVPRDFNSLSDVYPKRSAPTAMPINNPWDGTAQGTYGHYEDIDNGLELTNLAHSYMMVHRMADDCAASSSPPQHDQPLPARQRCSESSEQNPYLIAEDG